MLPKLVILKSDKGALVFWWCNTYQKLLCTLSELTCQLFSFVVLFFCILQGKFCKNGLVIHLVWRRVKNAGDIFFTQRFNGGDVGILIQLVAGKLSPWK